MIYLNGKPVEATKFPDKTSQVWKISEFTLKHSNWAMVTWDFSHEAEFLELAQLKSLLDVHQINASLKIIYLPYGRQDKKVENLATFALRPFASLLNSLEFQEVLILDPHSLVATELIKNSKAIYPTEELVKAINRVNPDVICYPDKGAVSKYRALPVYSDYQSIYGEKVRDQLTGVITSQRVIGDPAGKTILIVDDICDGGMTFKILAKALLEQGALEVHLFVTYGIFSKGLKTLADSGIKRIFTHSGECVATDYIFT